MKWKSTKLQAGLYLIGAVILLIGLGSALLIYLTADSAADNMLVYEFENSKRYRHDLELYGGKLTVFASDFTRWFTGLWQGKSLAFTVACITIVTSSGFFLAARLLPPDVKPDSGDRNDQAGTG
jgi:hypothetical protein